MIPVGRERGADREWVHPRPETSVEESMMLWTDERLMSLKMERDRRVSVAALDIYRLRQHEFVSIRTELPKGRMMRKID